MNIFNLAMIAAFWITTYMDFRTSGGREKKSWFGISFTRDANGNFSSRGFWIVNTICFAVAMIPVLFLNKEFDGYGGWLLGSCAFAHLVIAVSNYFDW